LGDSKRPRKGNSHKQHLLGTGQGGFFVTERGLGTGGNNQVKNFTGRCFPWSVGEKIAAPWFWKQSKTEKWARTRHYHNCDNILAVDQKGGSFGKKKQGKPRRTPTGLWVEKGLISGTGSGREVRGARGAVVPKKNVVNLAVGKQGEVSSPQKSVPLVRDKELGWVQSQPISVGSGRGHQTVTWKQVANSAEHRLVKKGTGSGAASKWGSWKNGNGACRGRVSNPVSPRGWNQKKQT